MTAPLTIVLDYDGTVTEDDMLDRMLREFGDSQVYEDVEAAFTAGELRLVDDIALKLATVRAPLDEVVGWLRRETHVRPGFEELVRRARARDWRLVLLTSSFYELVYPLLGRLPGRADLIANRLEARPDGWRSLFADGEKCPVCGEPCKRATLLRLAAPEVIYIGDGYSDRCAARAADRVFARDGLARYLDELGVDYEPFADFHDVLDALEREPVIA